MSSVIIFFKERKREICLYTVFVGIYAMVSYLYNIRVDAVWYAFLLSAVWLLLFGILDYVRFWGKHRELLEVEQGLESGLESMPDSAALIEEDYQRIIRKLYEARVELESAERIRGQETVDYYCMWVHQIKTPIAAMHVLLQALDDSQISEEEPSGGAGKAYGKAMAEQSRMGEIGEYLREMKLELFKIEQYVEMVLTYLRMGGMSSDLSFENCSLDSIIKQAVRKYSQMFILKKIRLEYTPVKTKVLTDEKWLVFVIEQLLSNALKYSVSSGTGAPAWISVHMEDHVYERTDQNSGKILGTESCLVIEDTGIGICPEDLPRVFEKGFTGYNGRTDKKSTGIGLYLCKSVTDKLRHQIWITSEVGKGTKVYLSLGRRTVRHE